MPPDRRLTALFVRPPPGRALSVDLDVAGLPEGPDVLPLGLVRLASVVKLGSPHRAVVHDAMGGEAGAAHDLRAAARLHRPDVALVWLSAAHLDGALVALRALRAGGCGQLWVAGPLLSAVPWAAGLLPEVDGALELGAERGLLAALDAVAAGQATTTVARCRGEVGRALPGVDRKLVDYAAYRGVGGSPWSGRSRPRPARSDKGRWAASAVAAGGGRGLEEVISDIAECDRLGIPWVDVVDGPSRPEWWRDLLGGLIPRSGRRLRLQLGPSVARTLGPEALRRAGVVAVDLGPVAVGDGDRQAEVLQVAALLGGAGLAVGARARLGRPGFDPAVEESGARELLAAGIDLGAAVHVPEPAPGDPAWSRWLAAPSARFTPPGASADALLVAARLGRVDEGRPGGRRARWRRLLDLAR